MIGEDGGTCGVCGKVEGPMRGVYEDQNGKRYTVTGKAPYGMPREGVDRSHMWFYEGPDVSPGSAINVGTALERWGWRKVQ